MSTSSTVVFCVVVSVGGCVVCAVGGVACLGAILRVILSRFKNKSALKSALKSDDCDSSPCSSHKSGCRCCK